MYWAMFLQIQSILSGLTRIWIEYMYIQSLHSHPSIHTCMMHIQWKLNIKRSNKLFSPVPMIWLALFCIVYWLLIQQNIWYNKISRSQGSHYTCTQFPLYSNGVINYGSTINHTLPNSHTSFIIREFIQSHGIEAQNLSYSYTHKTHIKLLFPITQNEIKMKIATQYVVIVIFILYNYITEQNFHVWSGFCHLIQSTCGPWRILTDSVLGNFAVIHWDPVHVGYFC